MKPIKKRKRKSEGQKRKDRMARPPLRRTKASRDLRRLKESIEAGNGRKQARDNKLAPVKKASGEKRKYDILRGRFLYAGENDRDANGRPVYKPRKSDATEKERDAGFFLPDIESDKTPDPSGKTKREIPSGRTLYLATDKDGNQSYVPKKSEATPHESGQGLYIEDTPGTHEKIAGETKTEIPSGRKLFPTRGPDGTTTYLPEREDATPFERSNGLYVKAPRGSRTIAGDLPTKKDPATGRTLYPSRDDDGNTDYLPRERDATEEEIENDRYVKNNATHRTVEDGIDSIPEKITGRRLYPSRNDDGTITYLPKESEATEQEKDDIKYVKDSDTYLMPRYYLKPKWDILRGRILYPVEGSGGKTTYAPLRSEATSKERSKGFYMQDPEDPPAQTVQKEQQHRAERAGKLRRRSVAIDAEAMTSA